MCLSFLSFSGLYATSFINLDKIQQLAQSHSGDTQKRFKAWAKLIENLKNKPVSAKLEGVNSFFNMFHYQDEGLSDDYWKSPDEFIVDGGGDCEDYAIIKYFTLATLGVSTDKLRITYVTSLNLNRAHMVLAYYSSPEAEPLILDSLENSILKASLRPDLKPVYSFNGSGLWLAKQRGKEAAIGQPSSLGKWDELMKRMQ
ncbi:MAG TPA: transglutaminase-like cysteine peptidase [Legionella sp.]|nr:transglutaminase-like cysteine peptidase [Legionella sp.]